jgi:hypothetical protein
MYRFEWIVAAAVAAASSACSGGGEKNACETQSDCVEGFLCEQGEEGATGTCEPIEDGVEFGEFYPFTAETGGSTHDYDLTVAVTSLSGGPGCALVADQDTAPGRQAAQVFARFATPTDSIHTCPEGNYGLRNASTCADGYLTEGGNPGSIPIDCALYRVWDADGRQASQLFALGGSLSVEEQSSGCVMTLDVSFRGGTVAATFRFAVDDRYSEEPHCGE